MMQLIKSLLKVIIPLVAVFILFSIDARLGLAALLILLGYLMYLRRGNLIFFAASRKAAKKDYEATARVLKYGYDKGWLMPFHEIAYGFLLLKRLGRVEEAEKIINRVLNIPGLSGDDKGFAKLNLAMIHFYNKDIQKTLEVCEEIYPDYKTTNFYGSYGYFMIAGGDLEAALKINQEAYEFNKDNKVILDNLGQNYILLEMYENAEEIYSVLIGKKPEFPEAYYNYGILKEKTGDIDEAIYQMKIALKQEFTFLTTIDKETVIDHIEKLYEKRDETEV